MLCLYSPKGFAGVQESWAGVASTVNTVQLTTKCEYFNYTCTLPGGCQEVEVCDVPGEGKRNHCYVVWKLMEDGTRNITLKVSYSIRAKETCKTLVFLYRDVF